MLVSPTSCFLPAGATVGTTRQHLVHSELPLLNSSVKVLSFVPSFFVRSFALRDLPLRSCPENVTRFPQEPRYAPVLGFQDSPSCSRQEPESCALPGIPRLSSHSRTLVATQVIGNVFDKHAHLLFLYIRGHSFAERSQRHVTPRASNVSRGFFVFFSNPTPGIVINRPNGSDVYAGVLKDYTGEVRGRGRGQRGVCSFQRRLAPRSLMSRIRTSLH